jgi:hypothetical protein
MGKESLQIRKHIEEERARLDMNITKLERDFDGAKEFVTACWSSPITLAGIAIVVGLVFIEMATSRGRRLRPIQSAMRTVCDIAA